MYAQRVWEEKGCLSTEKTPPCAVKYNVKLGRSFPNTYGCT